MPADDRAMGERIHELVTAAAPALVPKTYYGMPAYARGKNGKMICFFKPKSKFKVRYSTFGFQPDAQLDDGEMWPVAFAVTKLTPAWRSRSPSSSRKPRAERWPATGARSRSAAPARTTSATSASTSRSAG